MMNWAKLNVNVNVMMNWAKLNLNSTVTLADYQLEYDVIDRK